MVVVSSKDFEILGQILFETLVLRHLANKGRDQNRAHKLLPPILGPTLAAAHFFFVKCEVLKLEHDLLLLTLTSMAMLVEWA